MNQSFRKRTLSSDSSENEVPRVRTLSSNSFTSDPEIPRQRTFSTNSITSDTEMSRKRTLSSTSVTSDTESSRKRTLSSTSVTSDSAESTTDTNTDNELTQARTMDNQTPSISSNLPYSSVAQKMMAKMGYKAGKGLGKYEHGRVNIIEASKQRGLRGLGLKLTGLEGDTSKQWHEDEDVMIKQEPEWIPANKQTIPSLEELNCGIVMGERKEIIHDEVTFITEEVLKDILENKNLFDNLTVQELNKARSRANPYELIRAGIFLNRAAMKMAEMDSSFDFLFTNHKFRKRDSSELLYFADICAGPGGFSEYVLWREKWHSKGFGFTIRESWANDFKLSDFIAGTPETFDCHYGKDGYQGDGDIFKDENIIAFQQYVKENSDNLGVHFVMADGGFSVEGKENIQEILSKQLYLCQFLCAMSILRIGGHFLCKVFDLFTPFSVGLVYLLYRAFEEICIFKPVTSRPANSERYVVCKGLRPGTEPIQEYLRDLNNKINNLQGSCVDIREVVPVEQIKGDKEFFDYVYKSNMLVGERQVSGLKKLVTYIQNTQLTGPDQEEVKKQCCNAWNVPNLPRMKRPQTDPGALYNELLTKNSLEWMNQKVQFLNKSLLEHVKSIHDYKCTFSGDERCYLLSMGRFTIFKWTPSVNRLPTWRRLEKELNLELPRSTLLDVEFVMEYMGDGRGQRKSLTVHIIDSIFLGEEYVGDKSLSERCKYNEAFAKALSKNCRNDVVRVRAKPYFSLSDIEATNRCLEVKQMKKINERKLAYLFEDGRYFIPLGVYLVRRIKDPWHLQYSRSSKRLYFYNSATSESVYEGPKESIADVQYCTEKLLFLEMENSNSEKSLNISKDDVINFVASKLRQ